MHNVCGNPHYIYMPLMFDACLLVSAFDQAQTVNQRIIKISKVSVNRLFIEALIRQLMVTNTHYFNLK